MEPILPIISVYHHFFVLNGHQVVFHYTINDPLHTIFWLAGCQWLWGNGYDGFGGAHVFETGSQIIG